MPGLAPAADSLFFASPVWTGDIVNRCARTWLTLSVNFAGGLYAMEGLQHHEPETGIR